MGMMMTTANNDDSDGVDSEWNQWWIIHDDCNSCGFDDDHCNEDDLDNEDEDDYDGEYEIVTAALCRSSCMSKARSLMSN